MKTETVENTNIEVTEVLDAEQLPTITSEDLALIGVGSAGVCLVVLVGGVVAGNAMLISVLSLGGATILWIKLPATLEKAPALKWIVSKLPLSEKQKAAICSFEWKPAFLKHELLIDLIVSLGAFAFFGLTIAGMISAGLVGLSISVVLRLRKLTIAFTERARMLSDSHC